MRNILQGEIMVNCTDKINWQGKFGKLDTVSAYVCQMHFVQGKFWRIAHNSPHFPLPNISRVRYIVSDPLLVYILDDFDEQLFEWQQQNLTKAVCG